MPMGYRHGGFFDGFGHGPGLFGLVLMLVFWAAIALVVLVVLRNWRHSPYRLHDHAYGRGPGAGSGAGSGAHVAASVASPAIEVLRERFAKGEVSEEEFTSRLTLLKES